jgi:hypothetical protein
LYEKYPWIDNELNEIKRLRDYYYTRNRKNPNDIDYESYKLYRNLYQKQNKVKTIDFFSSKTSKDLNNSKNLGIFIKAL